VHDFRNAQEPPRADTGGVLPVRKVRHQKLPDLATVADAGRSLQLANSHLGISNRSSNMKDRYLNGSTKFIRDNLNVSDIVKGARRGERTDPNRDIYNQLQDPHHIVTSIK